MKGSFMKRTQTEDSITKRVLQIVTIAAMTTPIFAFVACDTNSGPAEEAGEAIDDAADNVGDAIDDAADEVDDAIDP